MSDSDHWAYAVRRAVWIGVLVTIIALRLTYLHLPSVFVPAMLVAALGVGVVMAWGIASAPPAPTHEEATQREMARVLAVPFWVPVLVGVAETVCFSLMFLAMSIDATVPLGVVLLIPIGMGVLALPVIAWYVRSERRTAAAWFADRAAAERSR